MTLAEVIQKTVQDAAKRSGDAQDFMERTAERLNRSVPWLYNAINPHDEKHKLSPNELLAIMEICEDYSALEHLSARCGFGLSPLGDRAPNGRNLEHECMQMLQAAAQVAALAEDGAKYVEVIAAVEALYLEAQDVAKRVRAQQAQGNVRFARQRRSTAAQIRDRAMGLAEALVGARRQ